MNRQSSKETVTKFLIGCVVHGTYKIGDRLPPERDLAIKLGISRIIVHSAIVELTAKGLLRIAPRKGVFINDYKRFGGLEIVDLLLSDPAIMDMEVFTSIMKTRRLFETEFAGQAALNRKDENLKRIVEIIAKEKKATKLGDIAELDFAFHHEIAHASGNIIYPLIIKSIKDTYLILVKEFYGVVKDRTAVIASHEALYEAILDKSDHAARIIMTSLLDFGESHMPENSGKIR